jgi:SAM-dependent methyltransferase
MSFQPLPEFLEKGLSAIPGEEPRRILDLGCGPGRLRGFFERPGWEYTPMDRTHPRLGTAAVVQGDALCPPFQAGVFDLVVVGNLFRHVYLVDGPGSFLQIWQELLRPAGMLLILEDQPTTSTPARENYNRLQAFLARLMPGNREPLLGLDDFRKWLAALPVPVQGWQLGLQENSWPADTQAVVGMLRGQGGPPRSEVADLIASIGEHGLDYGEYWWAAWRAPEEE